MKSLLIIILSILSLSCFSQMTMNARHFTARLDTTSSTEGNYYSDNFDSYTVGVSLGGQGLWLIADGDADVASPSTGNVIHGQGETSGSFSILFYNAVVGVDQFSKDSTTGSGGVPGVACRINPDNGGNGYLYLVGSESAYFASVVNGVENVIGSATVTSGGHVPHMTATGANPTIITCYLDGVPHSGLSNTTDGTFENSDHDSGFVGLGFLGSASQYGATADNWTGGDLP